MTILHDGLLPSDSTSSRPLTSASVRRFRHETPLGMKRGHGPAQRRSLPRDSIYQISISVSSSTPNRSRTWVCTNSIKRSTWSLLSTSANNNEIPVLLADFSATDFGTFEPRLFDQIGGSHATGILENASHTLITRRLLRFLDDPQGLHPFGQFHAIFPLQRKCGSQNDQFIEAAVAIGKAQIVPLMFHDLAAAGHHFGMAGPLSDIMVFGSRIASQRSANRSRNTDQVFQASQTFAHGRRDDDVPVLPRRRPQSHCH